MTRTTAVILAWFACFIFATNTVADAADVIAVSAEDFDAALRPWVSDRRQNGLDVAVVRPASTADQTRERIAAVVDAGTWAIVLVGDAPVYGRASVGSEVPTFERPTTVSGKFNSTRTLATDAPYAGDHIDRIAVGRLPVRTADELEIVVAKILASDRSIDFRPWRNAIELVGGVGGFGPMIDTAVESTARTILTSSLPAATRGGVLFGSPGHRFYPNDRTFRDAVVDRYRDGCRFWIYAGHGQVASLDRVPPRTAANPDGGPAVLDESSVDRLRSPHPSIALMLACFNGAIDAPQRCIAERMLVNREGPVAVLAGTRVTMPYGNSKLALALIDAVYHDRAPRLGQAWVTALASIRDGDGDNHDASLSMMLDAIAAMMHGDAGTAKDERVEHALLFQLLGDPTMRLHPPQQATIEFKTDPGTSPKIHMTSPIAGAATFSIDVPLGGQTVDTTNPNRTTLWQKTVAVGSGQAAEIAVPADIVLPSGRWYLARVHVDGDTQWATAASKFFVPAIVGDDDSNASYAKPLADD